MNIKIDFYLIVSIVVLTVFKRVEPFLLFYFFVVLHELAHIMMALLLRVKLLEISFLPFGVNAKFDFGKQKIKEIIIACAGPVFSISMAFLFPEYMVQNLFIAIVNLLPIYPLDGGRMLKNIFLLVFGGEKGSAIYQQFLKKFLIVIVILNIVVIIFGKNYNFLFVSFYIFQIAGEEIKKDQLRSRLRSLLNIEI